MARTFPADFTAVMDDKSSAPYMILEIQWAGVTLTKYYLDRGSTDFTASGTRVPTSGIGTSKVMEWGGIGLSLKEGQVGAVDQTAIKLDDAAGELTAILNLECKQRKTIKVWRMFDDATVTWPADAALMLQGTLRPFDWSGADNQLTLNIRDGSDLLTHDVSCIAKQAVFTTIPKESRDRNIPLAWGNAKRVEALLVGRPWETRILQGIDGSYDQDVAISDHPTDLGVTPEVSMQAWLNGDPVTVTFHQSADPDNVYSTVTVKSTANQVVATAVAVYTFDTATNRFMVIPTAAVTPYERRDVLTSLIRAGDPVLVFLSDTTLSSTTTPPYGWNQTTVNQLTAHTPWPDHYKLTVTDANVNLKALPGAHVKFQMGTTNRPPAPAGSLLTAYDGKYIYAASALPSKAVDIVEGYGQLPDQFGERRKDFIVIGNFIGDELQSGTCFENQLNPDGYFTINLDDDTWASAPGGGLGRNITTITFPLAPRFMCPQLDDNRIWVTLKGVEDVGDSFGNLITNPARVIQKYLEHAKLMNVGAANVNQASFNTAATTLTAFKVGWAQTEPMEGLALLQELARQCHSVVFFDQGQVYITVLRNTAGTSAKTFDTVANDNILLGAVSLEESPVEDVVNELTFKWRQAWDDITGHKPMDVKGSNAASVTAFGKMAREMGFDLYWRRADVESEVAFWLARWTTIYRHVKLSVFHDGLSLQPGDWITVSYIDGEARTILSAQVMEVRSVRDTGLQGLVEIEGRFAKYTY